jgi:hypothetical protein
MKTILLLLIFISTNVCSEVVITETKQKNNIYVINSLQTDLAFEGEARDTCQYEVTRLELHHISFKFNGVPGETKTYFEKVIKYNDIDNTTTCILSHIYGSNPSSYKITFKPIRDYIKHKKR